MDFKTLYEELKEASKFLYESTEYKLTIITGRDRDSDGELTKTTFTAKNDVDAFYKVLAEYNTCCQGYFNGEYADELDEKEKEMMSKIDTAKETGENQEEAINLMSDLYHRTMDISDYYDDIVTINRPDGSVVFEDDIDIEGWFGDEEEIEDEEEMEDDFGTYEENPEKTKSIMKQLEADEKRLKIEIEKLNKEGYTLFLTDRTITDHMNNMNFRLSVKDTEDFDDAIGRIYINKQGDFFELRLFMDERNLYDGGSLQKVIKIIKDNYNAAIEHKQKSIEKFNQIHNSK